MQQRTRSVQWLEGMRALAIGAAAATLTGCANYRVPGEAADFRAMGISQEDVDSQTDASIAELMRRQPLASFPASIAVAHVQGPGYRSWTHDSYGRGRYSLVMDREAERDEHVERLTALPMVATIGPLNRLIVTEQLDDQMDIRRAAAQVRADMVLLYTFDTRFGTETLVPALGTFTLGLFPAEQARVTTTASAALIDTRSGFVYWLGEGSAKKDQLANLWTSTEAVDQSRRRAEAEAFHKLVGEFEASWPAVVQRFARPGSPEPVIQSPPSYSWSATDLK